MTRLRRVNYPAHDTEARTVQRTYLVLTLLTTLASSFIWGINTLFLLDAGLTNTEAFAANAFFAVGQVIFEVPTGVVADTRGRRFSFLLGTVTLLASTLLYFVMWQIHATFIGWALASILLGLGFTFFSGATEAWLVDALSATGFTRRPGVGLRAGSDRQRSRDARRVGAGRRGRPGDRPRHPYILRAVMLGVTLIVAGGSCTTSASRPGEGRPGRRGAGRPSRLDRCRLAQSARALADARDPIHERRQLLCVLRAQPYLLELYGDPGAYGVAGLAAAIFAGAQIVGGLIVPRVRRLFRRRTDALLIGGPPMSCCSSLIGLTGSFVVAVALLPDGPWSSPSRGRCGRRSSTASSRPSNERPSCRSTR